MLWKLHLLYLFAQSHHSNTIGMWLKPHERRAIDDSEKTSGLLLSISASRKLQIPHLSLWRQVVKQKINTRKKEQPFFMLKTTSSNPPFLNLHTWSSFVFLNIWVSISYCSKTLRVSLKKWNAWTVGTNCSCARTWITLTKNIKIYCTFTTTSNFSQKKPEAIAELLKVKKKISHWRIYSEHQDHNVDSKMFINV